MKPMTLERTDKRRYDELRPVKITPGWMPYAEGSVLIEMGDTRIVCTASFEERVPPFLRNTRQGWLTAEYAMLPRATQQRTQRDSTRPGTNGRTQEIQRLIGRSLRAVVDLKRLGERTLMVDCDVLQADGGTRTASITGAFVAVRIAVKNAIHAGRFNHSPIKGEVAAVSCGIVSGVPLLDLKYDEDSRAEVDMNFVCAGDGKFIEVQGTAEAAPFTREEMNTLLDLARVGTDQLFLAQRQAIEAG